MNLTTIKINKAQFIHDDYFDVIDLIPHWLHQNVGHYAESLKSVSEKTPWFVQYDLRHVIYHFYREEDATLFALRWS
jgi:hypothetical protein